MHSPDHQDGTTPTSAGTGQPDSHLPPGVDGATIATSATGATILAVALWSWIRRHIAGTDSEVARQRAEQDMLAAYRNEVQRALDLAETYRKRADEAEKRHSEAMVLIARLEGKIESLSAQILEAEAIIASANEQAISWRKKYEEKLDACKTCFLRANDAT